MSSSKNAMCFSPFVTYFPQMKKSNRVGCSFTMDLRLSLESVAHGRLAGFCVVMMNILTEVTAEFRVEIRVCVCIDVYENGVCCAFAAFSPVRAVAYGTTYVW